MVITGHNELDLTSCCQIKFVKENRNANENDLEHESKRQHGSRRQKQLKIRGCVAARGTIRLMTWQTLRDLKPRLFATNVIQLSIGSFRDIPCSVFGPVLISRSVVGHPFSVAGRPVAWFSLCKSTHHLKSWQSHLTSSFQNQAKAQRIAKCWKRPVLSMSHEEG